MTNLQDIKILGWLLRIINRFGQWCLSKPPKPILLIRISKDDPDLNVGNLEFEVENASQTLTSLRPIVESSFLFRQRKKFRKGHGYYDVRELDRQLPPYQPKIFSAVSRGLPQNYIFSWFRVYTFRTTTGVAKRVRIRNVLLEQIGFFRFHYERLRFKLTGTLKEYGAMNVEEYEVRKRSQSPH
jgi:hypothetical protein